MPVLRRTALVTTLAGAVLSLGLAAAPAAAAAEPGPRVSDVAGDARTPDRPLRPGQNQPQADLLLLAVDRTATTLSTTLTAGAVDSTGATTYRAGLQLQRGPEILHFDISVQGGSATAFILTNDSEINEDESVTPPTVFEQVPVTPVYDPAARTVRVDLPLARVDEIVTEFRGSPLDATDPVFLAAGTELQIPARLLQPAVTVRDGLVQSSTFGMPLGG